MSRLSHCSTGLAPVLAMLAAFAPAPASAQGDYSDDAAGAPQSGYGAAPAQPYARQAPTQPAYGQAGYGQTVPGQTVPGQTVPGQPIADQQAGGVHDYTDDQVTYRGGSQAPAGTTGAGASPEPMADGAGNPDGYGAGGYDAPPAGGEMPDAGNSGTGGGPSRKNAFGETMGNGRAVSLRPYIELGQGLAAPITPAGRVSTYSQVAAGADLRINGTNNSASASLRYERTFNETDHVNAGGLSGLARGASAIVPGTLRLDYGGYASRFSFSPSGGAGADGTVINGATSQAYSVFAGPSLSTHLGAAGIAAHYQAGYSDIGTSTTINGTTKPVTSPNSFSHSFDQDAGASISTKPAELLPVGLAAEVGYHQENDSLLKQRIVDEHARGSVTVPVTHTLALVGSVGYEKVRVSSGNVQLDSSGNPVVGGNGQYVTDPSAPRLIAFDSSGLIWDAGVVWHPSQRTQVEAHYGRRYGGWTVWGQASWRPSRRSAFHVTVQDQLVGFGGALTGALAGAPTQFAAVSDPITGNVGSCVASLESGSCLASVLGSATGNVYRDRSISGVYSLDLGHIQTGFGLGYDRHENIGAPGSVLASVNGRADQYYWVATYLSDRLDRRSTLYGSIDAYRFESGTVSPGNTTSIRATGTYSREFTPHLTASASVAIDGLDLESLEDVWGATGQVAVRYSF